MNARNAWSRILIIAGGIGMLVGAIDPMEGSLLILPGSGLFAIGTCIGRAGRRLIAYRVSVFILIAIGVAALWGLSAVGGFGGTSGRSRGGTADSALSGRMADGHLGAGQPALVLAAGPSLSACGIWRWPGSSCRDRPKEAGQSSLSSPPPVS